MLELPPCGFPMPLFLPRKQERNYRTRVFQLLNKHNYFIHSAYSPFTKYDCTTPRVAKNKM